MNCIDGLKLKPRKYEHTLRYIEAYARALNTAKTQNSQIQSLDDLHRTLSETNRYRAPGIGWYNPSKILENPVAGVIRCLRKDKMSQTEIARLTGMSNALIAKWKIDTKPNKYTWWLFSLQLEVPPRLLPAFLNMIGARCDDLCLQDTILKIMQQHPEDLDQLPEILDRHGCLTGELKKALDSMSEAA